MKIQQITHPSGLKQEAIILFPNDEYSNYIVFEDIDNPGYSIIEIDRRSGFSIKKEYCELKKMSDKEIFNCFFMKNK